MHVVNPWKKDLRAARWEKKVRGRPWTALDWTGPRGAAHHHDANTAHESAYIVLRAGLATRLQALLAISIAPEAFFFFSVDRRIDTRFLYVKTLQVM